MISPVLETQLMRLADGIAGYTEHDTFAALNAQTPEAREEVRAALQDLVARGKLRPSDSPVTIRGARFEIEPGHRRYFRVRES